MSLHELIDYYTDLIDGRRPKESYVAAVMIALLCIDLDPDEVSWTIRNMVSDTSIGYTVRDSDVTAILDAAVRKIDEALMPWLRR